MELYLRFVTTLAFGLVGLSMVLKVLLEEVFHDWDIFADLGAWIKSLSEARPEAMASARAEDLLLAIEKAKNPGLTTRLIDLRREQLREIDAIEHRIKRGNQKVVLTPIAPPPVSASPEA